MGCLEVALRVERGFVTHLGIQVIVLLLVVHMIHVRLHAEALFGLCGTYVHAIAATGTVGNRHAHDKFIFLQIRLSVGELNSGGFCGRGLVGVQQERTDGCMRTYKCTVVALDTGVGIPHGDADRNAAFFVSGSACRHCAVLIGEECADGKGVSLLGIHHVGNFLDE